MVMCNAQPAVPVQFHWQNPANTSQTEFVAQAGGFQTSAAFHVWFEDIIRRRRHECPEGWGPMVCTQDSEHFVLASA